MPRPASKYKTTTEAAIRACIKDGLTAKQAAERLGCNPASLSVAMSVLGIKSQHRRGPRKAGFDAAKARKLLADGFTATQVARLYGISKATLHARLKAEPAEPAVEDIDIAKEVAKQLPGWVLVPEFADPDAEHRHVVDAYTSHA